MAEQDVSHSYLVPPTIWHPPTDRGGFAGAVGSSNILQRTQEESRSHICWITGIQISVSTVDLSVAYEPALVPCSCGPKAPGEHCLKQKQSHVDKRAFEEVQHIVGAKNQNKKNKPKQQQKNHMSV